MPSVPISFRVSARITLSMSKSREKCCKRSPGVTQFRSPLTQSHPVRLFLHYSPTHQPLHLTETPRHQILSKVIQNIQDRDHECMCAHTPVNAHTWTCEPVCGSQSEMFLGCCPPIWLGRPPGKPRDPHVSTSPILRLQVWVTTSSLLCGF